MGCVICIETGVHKTCGQVTLSIIFCEEALNICGSLIWKRLLDTLLAPRILRRLLDFWKTYATLCVK